MNEKKRLKYGVLRRFPGALGRHYDRKHAILISRTEGFADAVVLSGGMTCIDLGANLGTYTRRMAAEARQVIAFEPDPWTCAALRANLADLDNIRIENAAAGTSESKVLLHRHIRFEKDPHLYSQSSSIISDKNNVAGQGALEVRQIDFVRYLEDLDEDIGILKIDIEGAEVDLLEALFDRPGILDRIAHIFAETHENRIPGHRPRVEALRERARRIERPQINLDWQ